MEKAYVILLKPKRSYFIQCIFAFVENNRIYYQKVVPPGEFEGTQLHAPKFQKPRPKTFPDDDEDLNGSSQTPTAGKSRRTVTYKLPPLTDTDDKSSPDFTSVSSPDIHESKPAPK